MAEKYTPGPWRVFIDDSGDEWTGWPLSICAENDEDKSIVRPGGQWPYKWDAAMSQREAVANAHLISAAPDLLAALIDLDMRLRDCGALHTAEDAYDSFYRGIVAEAIAKARGAQS